MTLRTFESVLRVNLTVPLCHSKSRHRISNGDVIISRRQWTDGICFGQANYSRQSCHIALTKVSARELARNQNHSPIAVGPGSSMSG